MLLADNQGSPAPSASVAMSFDGAGATASHDNTDATGSGTALLSGVVAKAGSLVATLASGAALALPIHVVPGPANVGASSLGPSANTGIAGSQPLLATPWLRNAHNNPIAGAQVTATSSLSSSGNVITVDGVSVLRALFRGAHGNPVPGAAVNWASAVTDALTPLNGITDGADGPITEMAKSLGL